MNLLSLLQGVEGSLGGGDLPAAVAVFVQEAGMPLPLPIGALLLVVGYRSASQPLVLIGSTILLIEAASVLGASVKYWFGLKGGRPLLHTYGRYVRLGADRLHRSERQLEEHGMRAVALGRALPGVSMIVPLAAGALGMPYRRFLPATAIGSGLNIVAFIVLGAWAGQSLFGRLVQLGLSLRVTATLALVLVAAGALLVLRRRGLLARPVPPATRTAAGSFELALIAGLLAMFEMGVAINLALYVMTAVGLLEPERALLRFLDLSTRLAGGSVDVLVALIGVFVAGGVVWSLLYTIVAVRFLPGPAPVRGLLFSVVPFGTSMGLIWLLGFGPLGLGLGAGLIPFAGELTRCALFGMGLGSAEEMVRRALGAGGETPAPRPAIV